MPDIGRTGLIYDERARLAGFGVLRTTVPEKQTISTPKCNRVHKSRNAELKAAKRRMFRGRQSGAGGAACD
jgi:hypothetical protein